MSGVRVPSLTLFKIPVVFRPERLRAFPPLWCAAPFQDQFSTGKLGRRAKRGAFPMARPKAKAPARRYHISGQSVVTIAGRDFYLGPHDSPESIARYAVLIGIYQRNWLTLLLNTVTSAASACVLVAAGE